jgi:hypothetical protein
LYKLDELDLDTEGENQHGFRRNRSTTTAALTIQSLILNALDRGKKVLLYSIDMSAAFDLLRPDTLENLLPDIPAPLRRSLMDYIYNREMRVRIADSTSEPRLLTTGCIQGSVLGPRLDVWKKA